MKTLKLSALLLALLFLFSCAGGTPAPAATAGAAPDAARPAKAAPTAMPLADPETLRSALAAGKEAIIVVDVRTPEEFATGHIPGALNIPYDQITAKLPTEDRSATIVVYCRSGNRSGKAAATLLGLGFTNVADMGAFSSWKGEVAVE